jgi:hypothetical protein
LPATGRRIEISALEFLALDETGTIRDVYLEMTR